MKAVAIWNRDNYSKYSHSNEKITGYVLFTQTKHDGVKVNIYIEGLTDGLHGIHIHEKSLSHIKDLETANICELLGGHFNVGESWSLTEPNGTKHGEHTGDMCFNIDSKDNIVNYTYYDKKISLDKNLDNCVINRSVVIHSEMDDQGKGLYADEEKNSQTFITGNAGERVACAEIRLIKDPNF
mgnify:CR=1 FL=1